MKTPIAVALIIMGGLIVLAPVVSDYFYQSNVVALMSVRHDFTTVTIDGKMGDLYRIACLVLGSGMIGIPVFFSLFSSSQARHENLATQSI